jgi:polysaccharide export outer membrane protein
MLSGCGNMLPGMQNPNIASMPIQMSKKKIAVHPILIPITSTLIADQHISTYVYHVAPADVLDVSVWQHPEFNPAELHSGSAAGPSTQGAAGQPGYLVNPNGMIYFPLVGYVDVIGKTVDNIRLILTMRLRRYITNPQVNVRVSDFRGQKVYVFGEVLKPSFLPLNDQPLTIAEALTLSGNIDPTAADPSHIYVIRGSFTHPRIYWLNAKTPDALLLAEHFNLQPNDILYVSSATATRWNRVINQVLPTLQAVYFAKTLTNT